MKFPKQEIFNMIVNNFLKRLKNIWILRVILLHLDHQAKLE